MAAAQFAVIALRFFRCMASDSLELKGTARLLATVLKRQMAWRGLLLAGGAVALPILVPTGPALALALALSLGSEILGRYLFFVSVVPKHLAAPYLATAREAA